MLISSDTVIHSQDRFKVKTASRGSGGADGLKFSYVSIPAPFGTLNLKEFSFGNPFFREHWSNYQNAFFVFI